MSQTDFTFNEDGLQKRDDHSILDEPSKIEHTYEEDETNLVKRKKKKTKRKQRKNSNNQVPSETGIENCFVKHSQDIVDTIFDDALKTSLILSNIQQFVKNLLLLLQYVSASVAACILVLVNANVCIFHVTITKLRLHFAG